MYALYMYVINNVSISSCIQYAFVGDCTASATQHHRRPPAAGRLSESDRISTFVNCGLFFRWNFTMRYSRDPVDRLFLVDALESWDI